MSWSVFAVGKAEAAANKVEEQFAKGGVCREPEESIKQEVRKLIALAMANQSGAIKISASGHMTETYNDTDKTFGPPRQNTLKIEIEPLYGFIE